MYKKLGWIAFTGFAVGFTSLTAAYAVGGPAFMDWAGPHFSNLHRIDGMFSSGGDKCDADTTAVDITQTERRLPWTAGDKVRIVTSGNVHYRGGEGDEVIVRGAPEVIARVKIRGNRIDLDCDGLGFNKADTDIDVTLPGRPFNNVTLAGAGNITMENVKQQRIKFIIAGSGTIQAQGEVDQLDVSIAGSGNAKLGELKSREIDVNIAGSGDTEAAPSEEADIKIMGSGNIRLMTRPTRLKTQIMGSGRVIQAADQI